MSQDLTNHSKIIFFIIPILLILYFWKNTLLNINDHLYDWNDPPYTIYVIQNNIKHFKNLETTNLFDSNALYPFKYSLTFAENFFFPSLLLLPVSFFVTSPIAQLNILLVTNHILIFIGSYLLLGLFARNFWARIIAGFYLSFSPYLFSQLGHIHMMYFWPLLFGLYFFLKHRLKDKRNIVLGGVFMGLQFTTTAYLGIFGLFIVAIYYLSRLILERNRFQLVKEGAIFLIAFFLISSVSIYGYIQSKNTYGGSRDVREYITYSAHITDYLFPNGNQTSLIYTTPLINRWRQFDHHGVGEKAAFIGIIPLLILFFYILKNIRNKKNAINFKLTLTKTTFYLSLLALAGFILSLGPRLNANGSYLHIPLPYDLIIKYIPLITSLRALARWFFLVTLAMTIFIGLGLNRYFEHWKKFGQIRAFYLGLIIFGFFILEFYPSPLKASKQEWWSAAYTFMKEELCVKKNPAVLEYPFVYRNSDADVILNLQYKTKIVLASTGHNCRILSGWPSYEPDDFQRISNQLDEAGLDKKDINLLKNLGFSYLKINKFAITEEEEPILSKDLLDLGLLLIYNDEKVGIYKI